MWSIYNFFQYEINVCYCCIHIWNCIHFCRGYAMLKLTKYASASVYLCMNLWWRGGGFGVERKREILVQLNLINSEMEIISAWSTGKTRDSNREGKSERTNRRESRGTFRESRYSSLFLLSGMSTLTVCQKYLILELIFVCCIRAIYFFSINLSRGWYDPIMVLGII